MHSLRPAIRGLGYALVAMREGGRARGGTVVLLIWLLSAAARALIPEEEILLQFRSLVVDGGEALGDWRGGNQSLCGWTGVTCNSAGLVTGVDLSSKKLMCSELHLPLCDLPSLTSLQLQENVFSGPLPPELRNCTNLEHLNLGANNFTGPILEDSLSALPSLRYLNLSLNLFAGALPGAVGRLRELRVLDMVGSGVSGSLPAELGDLVEMTNLSLSWNAFKPGSLPPSFANLEQLRYFECAGCNLNGALPGWLPNLSRLEYFDLSNNKLSGAIPPSLAAGLPQLRWLELYKNELTGPIPSGIGNLTSLTDLDLSDNALTGSIPDGIAGLEQLGVLHLQNNSLEGPIPSAIVHLTKLYDLKLYMNQLTGAVPPALGSNCTLLQFDVSDNHLGGQIPPSLCDRGLMWRLILFNNSFTGNLPEAYGNCSSLIRIRISGNRFNGTIPGGVWGLPKLSLLEIYDNMFEGKVLPAIGNATGLTSLKIYDNKFAGPLPPEIGRLKMLERLHAHRNNFSGVIPPELGNLGSSVTSLYLDDNAFSGAVPVEIGNLSGLVYLGLARNRLSGPLPKEIGNLGSLIYLDVSSNALSGDLSEAMQNMKLNNFIAFNFSFNDFSGTLPNSNSLSGNLFPSGFLGNPNLCIMGTNSSSPMCNDANSRPSKGHEMLRISAAYIIGGVLAIALAFATMLALTTWYFCKRQGRRFDHGPSEVERLSPWSMTLFHRVTVTYKEVMECLDEGNVIGSGGGGKVYKATLRNGQEVAIKKLWGSGKGLTLHDHGFKAEVDTLGGIRHRNIVKLLCCCSSFASNLLVYEYMPKGSLGDLLHTATDAAMSDWSVRCRIATGAAQGLAYLHHDCVPQIVHRDIKSNNILLDNAYEAHVADFGLAKSLDDVSMSAVAGSYGYIAPEYAYTLKVSEKSDVYSFGVVLMELVTGRRPIEAEFGDGDDIVKWASRKLQEEEGVFELLDARVGSQYEAKMVRMLKVALFCTQPMPRARPTMRKVVEMLSDQLVDPPKIPNSASRDGKHVGIGLHDEPTHVCAKSDSE